MQEIVKINDALAVTDKVAEEKQRLKLAAKLLGYKELPPTIREFCTNKYYLGEQCRNLYPYWLTMLEKIFPNEIETNFTFLILTGSIGCGKSTVSKILALYQLCRLDHLVDARRTLGIMPGKYLVFAFNHKSIDLANKEFLDPLNEWMKSSPYFNGGMLHTDLEGLGVKFMADRSIGSTPAYIGTDLIFGVLSEINFVNPEIAANRLDTMTKRFGSRFDRVMDYFGMIIIDSSARGSTSIVDEFMADNPYGNKTISIRASRWEVREHMNYYGQKGWFKVFCGDGTHAPFIVDGHRMVTEDMDPDRVIDVPEECRPDFEMNIVTAIQDLAGISTMGSDQFFPNPEIITKCMTLQMLHEETILVDFYDLHDDLVYHLSKALSTIPKDRLVFIRVDYGANVLRS